MVFTLPIPWRMFGEIMIEYLIFQLKIEIVGLGSCWLWNKIDYSSNFECIPPFYYEFLLRIIFNGEFGMITERGNSWESKVQIKFEKRWEIFVN